MKETLTLTIKLLLICAIVTGLLAFVNSVTAPIIAENNQKTFEAAMKEILPDSDSFAEFDKAGFTPSESGVRVDSIYEGNNGGYVISAVCSEGYGGDISIMVGIDKAGAITQVKIMSMSETPGLGAKASAPDFIDQYSGLKYNIEVVKNIEPTGNRVSAISGATITSKAVTKAVNASLEATAFAIEKGGNI